MGKKKIDIADDLLLTQEFKALKTHCFQWLMGLYIHMDLHLDMMSGTAPLRLLIPAFSRNPTTHIVRPKLVFTLR